MNQGKAFILFLVLLESERVAHHLGLVCCRRGLYSAHVGARKQVANLGCWLGWERTSLLL